MDNLPPITVSDEAIANSVDLFGQIQRRQADALIAHERAELAAVTSDELAWRAYPPTPHDDPAEYAPYWVRATEVMPRADIEKMTAQLIESLRP